MRIAKWKLDLPRITMRVSILSLFLSLTFVAFGSTLAFLYYKNFKMISAFSTQEILSSSRALVTTVSNLLIETERVIQVSSKLVYKAEAISPENEWLRDYMWEIAIAYPNMPYFFVGSTNGNYLEVGNLGVSVQEHYLGDTSKALPKGVQYEWQYFIKKDGQIKAETYYYDSNFHEIASENISQIDYDPRIRPWYTKAVESNSFHWTDVYTFFDTGDPGISAAAPIHDSDGKIVGVFGADLSFEFLSRFFAGQTVGKTGKPFILSAKDGKILIPETKLIENLAISEKTVTEAYQFFRKTRETSFSFVHNKVRYLASIEPFPVETDADWLLAIVVPFNDFFSDLQQSQMEALLIVALICALSSLAIVYFAKRLSKPIRSLTRRVDELRRLSLDNNERTYSHIKEIYLMDAAVHSLRFAFRSFVRYVPRAIVAKLLEHNREIVLGGDKKEVTVAFSDITDFTSIAEQLSADQINPLLEEYFDQLSKIILKSQGTIDKYIGDGIMAFWGAPEEIPHHAAAGAEAVLLCNAFVTSLNEKRQKEHKPIFHTRFGIHTGSAFVGNIGTSERMNYTLMGDTVNSASRLQDINKTYHTNVIISEAVQQQIGPEFLIRPLGTVEVKGKKNKITIFELMGKKDGAPQIVPTGKQLRLAAEFTKGYEAMEAGNPALAKTLFLEIQREFPEDGPTAFYLDKISLP